MSVNTDAKILMEKAKDQHRELLRTLSALVVDNPWGWSTYTQEYRAKWRDLYFNLLPSLGFLEEL